MGSIDYDFAAIVNVFAAKISRLIFNDFAANFLTISRLFHVFSQFWKCDDFAAKFYDFAANLYQIRGYSLGFRG